MRRSVLLIFVSLALMWLAPLTAPVAAQQGLPTTFVGRWQGAVVAVPDTAGEGPVQTTIELSGGSVGTVVGTIDYPPAGARIHECGGDLTLQRVAADDRQVELAVNLTYGQAACALGAIVTLTLQGDDSVTYDWRHPTIQVTVTGTLRRIGGAPTPEPLPIPTFMPTPAFVPPTVTSELVPDPAPVADATDAERFHALLAAQRQVAPLAGPFRANLKESATGIDIAFANVDLADFHASAVVTVPLQTSTVPWDTGFRFRVPQSDVRVTVSSLGVWNLAIGVAAPSATGPAPNLVTTPGGTNVLDLFVVGQRAWLGVNETFVASIALPPGDAGDVEIGAGFFLDEIVDDRVTSFRGFVIRPLDLDALESPAPAPTATPAPLASLPEAFVGHWEGTATWENESLPVAMDLTGGSLGAVVGRIEYALYGGNGPRCGGDVSLQSVTSDGRQIELVGIITYEPSVCLIDATVAVSLQAGGAFVYDWRHPLLNVAGTGTLQPSVPTN